EAPRRFAAALVEDIADRHLGAGLDHQPGGLAADAARRPGDQRHLAVEPVHHFLLFKRSFTTEAQSTQRHNSVVPAKAGTHWSAAWNSEKWVPAFAGTAVFRADPPFLLCVLCASAV